MGDGTAVSAVVPEERLWLQPATHPTTQCLPVRHEKLHLLAVLDRVQDVHVQPSYSHLLEEGDEVEGVLKGCF